MTWGHFPSEMGVRRLSARQRREVAVGALSRAPGEGAVPPAAWTCHGYGTKVFTFAGDVQRPDWDPNRVKIDYEPRPRIVGFWKRFLMAEILLGDTGH